MATIPQGLGGSRGLGWRPAPCPAVHSLGVCAAGSGGQGLGSRAAAPAEAPPCPAAPTTCCSSPSSSSFCLSYSGARQGLFRRRHQPATLPTTVPRAAGSGSSSSSQPTGSSSSSSSHAAHASGSGNTGNTLNSGSGDFPTDPFKSAYDDRVPPGLAAGRNMVNTRTGPADAANADSSSDEDDPHHIARSAAVSSAAVTAGAASEAAAAQLAAAAVAVAAAQMAAPPPRVGAGRLLGRVAGLLRSHFLPVLLLYGLKDAAAFCLHRVVQRLTNHAAEVLLAAPTSTAGNPWWLFLDAGFMRAHPGYEVLVGLFFLVSLPLSIALNTLAFTTATLLCCPPELRPPEARQALEAAAARAAAAAAAAGGGGGGAGGSSKGGSAASGGPGPLQLEESTDALADLGIGVVRPASPAASSSSSTPGPSAASSPAPSTSGPTHTPAAAAATSATAAASASSSGTAATATDADGAPAAAADGSSAAAAAGEDGGGGGGLGAALAAAVRDIGALLPAVAAMLRRVWWVDMNINVRALPLQGLCLLVLPAFWALPRLMRIQVGLGGRVAYTPVAP
ncbi:hypothetical protein HXX76_011834 [Chlamydomonas incerta]|uniref:Uncharacterized protein n=1 Tax=Chlamydomonas incerta TaxID=51695 RepID=A0A835SJH7_CHLIN|nr:hypothetical protein HXX76_011834 [Chlamydomonas incerta]|eukprot:KAG2428154.1 hypothetical protein HXX76_011834 [Chlamydomonas incerta]